MSDQTLKPCPFCGGKAKYQEMYWYEGNSSGEYVFCTKCRVQNQRKLRVDDPHPITAWNTRATPTPPADDVEAVAMAIGEILNNQSSDDIRADEVATAAIAAMSTRQTDRIAALESEVKRLRGLVKRAEVFVPVGHYSWHDDARGSRYEHVGNARKER